MELLFKQLCKYTILGGYNLFFTDKKYEPPLHAIAVTHGRIRTSKDLSSPRTSEARTRTIPSR